MSNTARGFTDRTWPLTSSGWRLRKAIRLVSEQGGCRTWCEVERISLECDLTPAEEELLYKYFLKPKVDDAHPSRDGSPEQEPSPAIERSGNNAGSERSRSVSISWRRAIAVLTGVLLAAVLAGGPVAAQDQPLCVASGTKTARPGRVLLGEEVLVELTLTVDCPMDRPPVDIVVAIDRSGSMVGNPLESAIAAARSFIGHLSEPQHRVAVVSYSDSASLDTEFEHGLGRAHQALGWLAAEGMTSLESGLRAGREVLAKRSRADARHVVLILTDGWDTTYSDPLAAAAQLRADGVAVYAIGLGNVDQETLKAIATTPDYYRYAPTPADLAGVYGALVGPITKPAPGDVVVDDELAPDIDLISASANPPAVVRGSLLTWQLGDRPVWPMTMTYRVRPTRTGILPVNSYARAYYDDVDGVRRSYQFPVPQVEVYLPTATPTPTPEPTATPTPQACYLPFVTVERCFEVDMPIDAVLVLDVSGSMQGSKIEAARDGARLFVDALRLPSDRAALVVFSDGAQVVEQLTGDRDALLRGIGRFGASGWTDMHAGLVLARQVIDAGGRDPGRLPVIVLLSDGVPDDRDAARRAAQELKDQGVIIFTVAFGYDANRAFLETIASPGRAHVAPTREELLAAFEEIARRIVCR